MSQSAQFAVSVSGVQIGVLALGVAAASGGVAGWQAWMSYQNRKEAKEAAKEAAKIAKAFEAELRRRCQEPAIQKTQILARECLLQDIKDVASNYGVSVTEKR